MRTTYDPVQSVARALERWGRGVTRVTVEHQRTQLAELDTDGGRCEATAAEIVEFVRDAAEARGAQVLATVTAWRGDKAAGSLPVRVAPASDDDARPASSERELVKLLTSQLAEAHRTMIDSVKTFSAAQASILGALEKRLAESERGRDEAQRREREALDVAEAALETAQSTTRAPLAERVLTAIAGHYGIALDGASSPASSAQLEAPAEAPPTAVGDA